MREQTVGVIGGMGPEATVELMSRIIAKTPANDDVDHIHMIVDNDPKIPSRIKALLEGTGEDPGSYIANMARKLQTAGADFLVMPCNTAHLYRDVIAEAVSIPFWDMVGMSIQRLLNDLELPLKLGVLASTASINVGLFEKTFKDTGIDLLYPTNADQDTIFNVIRSVKSGTLSDQQISDFTSTVQRLVNEGAQALFVACTELSVIADRVSYPVFAYDTLEILANAIIADVKGQ